MFIISLTFIDRATMFEAFHLYVKDKAIHVEYDLHEPILYIDLVRN